MTPIIEQNVQILIGKLLFQIAELQAQITQLQEPLTPIVVNKIKIHKE